MVLVERNPHKPLETRRADALSKERGTCFKRRLANLWSSDHCFQTIADAGVFQIFGQRRFASHTWQQWSDSKWQSDSIPLRLKPVALAEQIYHLCKPRGILAHSHCHPVVIQEWLGHDALPSLWTSQCVELTFQQRASDAAIAVHERVNALKANVHECSKPVRIPFFGQLLRLLFQHFQLPLDALWPGCGKASANSYDLALLPELPGKTIDTIEHRRVDNSREIGNINCWHRPLPKQPLNEVTAHE